MYLWCAGRGLCTTGGKALSGNNGKVYTPEQIKPQVDFKFIVEHVQELEENVKLRSAVVAGCMHDLLQATGVPSWKFSPNFHKY